MKFASLTSFPFLINSENCGISKDEFQKKFLPSGEKHFHVAFTMFDCLNPYNEESSLVEPMRKEIQIIFPIMHTIFALGGE